MTTLDGVSNVQYVVNVPVGNENFKVMLARDVCADCIDVTPTECDCPCSHSAQNKTIHIYKWKTACTNSERSYTGADFEVAGSNPEK